MLDSRLQAKQGIINNVRVGSCLWNGTQLGAVISWPFLLSLFFVSEHLVGRTNFVWKVPFVGQLLSLSLCGESCLTTGSSHFRTHVPHCWEVQLELPP